MQMARWIKRCYVSLYNELLRNKVDYISNNFESFGALKARLENKEANIYKINNDFFVFNKYPRLLIFFVDSPKKIKLPKCYIKITKHDEKVQKFLALNDFRVCEKYVKYELDLSKQDIAYLDIQAKGIKVAKQDDALKIYEFLCRFFSPIYEIYLGVKQIKQKCAKNEVLVYKKDENIYGVLIFSTFFNTHLDFIAVDKQNAPKNLAFLLLCALNQVARHKITLFTQNNNHKAINFYERFGFKAKIESNIFLFTN